MNPLQFEIPKIGTLQFGPDPEFEKPDDIWNAIAFFCLGESKPYKGIYLRPYCGLALNYYETKIYLTLTEAAPATVDRSFGFSDGSVSQYDSDNNGVEIDSTYDDDFGISFALFEIGKGLEEAFCPGMDDHVLISLHQGSAAATIEITFSSDSGGATCDQCSNPARLLKEIADSVSGLSEFL